MRRLQVRGRALSRHIAEVQAWPGGLPAQERFVERLPDGTASLVFRSSTDQRAGDLVAIGAVSRAIYEQHASERLAVAVVFKLGGAFPFFGVPMQSVADRMIDLEDLWGSAGRDLLEQLDGAPDVDHAIATVERALINRLESAEDLELRSAVRVLRGVRKLLAERPNVALSELACAVGVSERHLRRVFATAVGVSPKQYLQMARFNRAVHAGPMSGGALAVAAGYHDQAHLISEFNHLARMTPRAFARRHFGIMPTATSTLINTPINDSPATKPEAMGV